MRTWQNCLKNVRKVFMPTTLNDEGAVNTITYLGLNVYESFSVCLSMFIANQDNC